MKTFIAICKDTKRFVSPYYRITYRSNVRGYLTTTHLHEYFRSL